MTRAAWLLAICLMAAPAAAGEAPFLRVLGIAQDGGLPHAGCTCVRCDAARQSDSPTYVASLALVMPQDPPGVILFDATPDLRGQLDLLADVRRPPRGGTDRSPVDGVFLTHAHIGHYTGLMFFGYEAIFTRELPVYASEKMATLLREDAPWSELVRRESIDIRTLQPGRAVALASGVEVEPLRVPHRDELSDTLGFIVRGPAGAGRRTALFVPDTDGWDAWQPSLGEVLDAEDVDLALLDATFFSLDELPGRSVTEVPHPLIRSSMDLLQGRVDAGALEVVFLHLNHSNPALDRDSDAAREIVARGFAVARQGQEFPLSR